MIRVPRTRPKLGPKIGEHGLRRANRNLTLTLLVLGFGGAIVAGTFAAWRWYFSYRHYGPAAVSRWSGPALGVSMVLTIVGCLALFSILKHRDLRVHTYTHGMVLERNNHNQIVYWTQIHQLHTVSVRYGLAGFAWGARTKLTLELKDNRRIHLTHRLADVDILTDTIKRNVYPGLLDEYRQRLNSGHAVPFGPLTITPHEIHKGRRTLPWTEVNRISLDRGKLRIRVRSRDLWTSMRFAARKVPNIELCIQLIQHLVLSHKGK